MIQLKNVKKEYGSFCLDCTLEVKPGAITGLIGQNGAGKSTTFKLLLGLIRPDSGAVTVLGKPVSDFTSGDRERLGVVLSDSGFSGYLTPFDLIPVLRQLYSGFDEAFYRKKLTAFGLPGNQQIKEFSTGMKAKLKLLAALSHKACLLILDEPTAGLDVIARDELLGLLRAYMEEDSDRAVLISSHISSDLEGLCDDLYWIHDGKILLHEDTDMLLDSYGLLKMTGEDYALLDKQYLLAVADAPYGYAALTDQRQYYLENYPGLTVEKGSIDGVITMLIKGVKP